MSSIACADVAVNGFSTKTCLPFSSAAFASSKCVQTGVTIATASMSAAIQHFVEVRRQMNAGIGFLRALQRLGVLVADRHDLASVQRAQVSDDVRAPVPVADHANSNDIGVGAGSRLLVG